jgi:hypothetical protein
MNNKRKEKKKERKALNSFPFIPEIKSWPEEKDKPLCGMLRDNLMAPISTKKVFFFSLFSTFKFFKGFL